MERPGTPLTSTQSSLTVPAHQRQLRLDSYLALTFPSYSRTFFTRLIYNQCIAINGAPATKPSNVIKPLDTITITLPDIKPQQPDSVTAAQLGITIVAEHQDFLIINKPHNLIVHKPSPHSSSITVADWLTGSSQIEQVGPADRPGIVHRLDKDTSGLMVIARTPRAHTLFGQMFKDRTIEKKYLAIVHGHPEVEGEITLSIGRHPITRNKMTTYSPERVTKGTPQNKNGIREAKSYFKVVEYFANCALIEVKPYTGRTHQIRVHMAALGHPIVGDTLYGKKSSLIDRQALHAYELSFTLDGQRHMYTQQLPEDFNQLVQHLRTS